MAKTDHQHFRSAESINLLRESINEMRLEEGQLPLTEEEWPSETEGYYATYYADHAITKIIEGYNAGKISEEGVSVWY